MKYFEIIYKNNFNPKAIFYCTIKNNFFFRSLSRVLKYNGGRRDKLIIYTAKLNNELLQLMQLFDIDILTPNIQAKHPSVQISHLYSYAMRDTLHKFPHSKLFIFIEDDVLVSPDFFQ